MQPDVLYGGIDLLATAGTIYSQYTYARLLVIVIGTTVFSNAPTL